MDKEKKEVSEGKCYLCDGTFSKRAMTKHLLGCKKGLDASSEGKKKKIFHLLVEGGYKNKYWLHLELPADAKLKDLDGFLRDIWLECCGHLSMFTIEEKRYGDADRAKSMNIKVGEILKPEMKFYHEYDFGTTTTLTLKVLSSREEIGRKGNSIELLARNNPPLILCELCKKPATQVCSQCIWEGNNAWFCDKCAKKHEDKNSRCEDMFLPVVNSPRVGMCGYTG